MLMFNSDSSSVPMNLIHLNTSHVNVQLKGIFVLDLILDHLNTSHVNVQSGNN